MIRTLHSLRFVFIMLVVADHMLIDKFYFGGECGVSFFFMVSGFVLSVAYGQKIVEGTFRHRTFFLRQLLKFYPLHLLTFLAFVILDARIGMLPEWYRLLPSVLLLQSWIPDNSFFFVANGSSWFLSDMLFFYLLLPTLYRWSHHSRWQSIACTAALLLIGYIVVAFALPEHLLNAILYAAPLSRTIDFTIGMLIHRCYASKSSATVAQWLLTRSSKTQTLIEILFVCSIVAAFFIYGHTPLPLRSVALFWCFMPPFIYFFSLADAGQGRVTQLLQHPIMQWLGNISFEIFLVHMLVIRLANSLLFPTAESRSLSAMLVYTVATLIGAWLTKRFFVDKIYGIGIKLVK